MAQIPRNLLQLWGFKDDFGALPNNIASLRKENMKFLMELDPGWSFHLLGPSDVFRMLRHNFSAADSEVLIKAFSVGNAHWIQRVDMARFVALYVFGGLYIDLDVQITADLTPILEASVVITRGNSKSHIELDIVAARAGDRRVLELLRSQAGNVLKKRGEGLCPDASVSPTTGVHLVTAWCKRNNISGKPLADRFIVAKGRGSCKAILQTYNNQTWACTIKVSQPFFEVHHAASWCRSGQGLKKSAFKPTIKDKTSLGILKGWNAEKKTRLIQSEVDCSQFHPTVSIPKLQGLKKTGERKTLGNRKSCRATQLSLIRVTTGAFPAKDFPKLSTVSEVKKSTDNVRTKLARVLVNKDLNETRRKQLVEKISNSKTRIGLVEQALIDSKGQMTPALKRFLSYTHSAKTIKQWKTGVFKNTVFRNQWDPNNYKEKQISRLRMARGSFPVKDFPKLSSVAEANASTDTHRTKVARVLVNKDLTEKRREQILGEIVSLSLLTRVRQALIDSKGQMTPALKRYLKGGRSEGQLKRFKKCRNT